MAYALVTTTKSRPSISLRFPTRQILGIGRLRPMPSIVAARGTSTSTMVASTTAVRAATAASVWCEPDSDWVLGVLYTALFIVDGIEIGEM